VCQTVHFLYENAAKNFEGLLVEIMSFNCILVNSFLIASYSTLWWVKVSNGGRSDIKVLKK